MSAEARSSDSGKPGKYSRRRLLVTVAVIVGLGAAAPAAAAMATGDAPGSQYSWINAFNPMSRSQAADIAEFNRKSKLVPLSEIESKAPTSAPVTAGTTEPKMKWVSEEQLPPGRRAALLADLDKRATTTSLKRYLQTQNIEVESPVPTASKVSAAAADLRTECKAHIEATTTAGWHKSAYEACWVRGYNAYLYDLQDKTILGRIQGNLWVFGSSYDHSRKADLTASLEDIQVAYTKVAQPSTWRHQQSFRQSVSDGTVTPPAVSTRDALLTEWQTTPLWTVRYLSPDSGVDESGTVDAAGKPNAQKAMSTVTLVVAESSPGSVPSPGADAARTRIRFDTGDAEVGKTRGPFSTIPKPSSR